MGKWEKYKKRYNNSWENDPAYRGMLYLVCKVFSIYIFYCCATVLTGWIQKSKNDPDFSYCKICECEIRSHKADLSRHANTAKHKQNSVKLDPAQNKIQRFGELVLLIKILIILLNVFYQIGIVVFGKEKKTEEIRYSLFIAQHSSIRSVDHLIDIRNESISLTSSAIKENLRLHRTKCSAIIRNVIDPVILGDIIKDVEGSFYSLIVDESTDVSTEKYLCICIKYYSKTYNEIFTHFLGLIRVLSTTSSDLFETLKSYIESLGLKLSKLIGLGTDGANNLCGAHNSLFIKLKEYSPNIILMKCVCHSLHLCSSKASLVFNNEVDFILRETYNWFKYSAQRRAKYHRIFRLINDEAEGTKNYNFIQLSQTRWLSRYNAVDRIVSQYLELQTFFEISAEKESCHTALLLHKAFQNKRNYLILLFLRPILKQLNTLNMYFQKEQVDFFQAYVEIKNFIFSLASKILKEKDISSTKYDIDILLEILSDKNNLKDANIINFNEEFSEKAKESSEIDLYKLKKDCQTFIYVLMEELIKRLPSHLNIFQKAFVLSPQLCLSHIRTPFSELPLYFLSESERRNVEIEYDLLLNISWRDIFKNGIPVDSEEFWREASNIKTATGDKMLKHISEFAFILLSLPHSNAFVERVFSVMNSTKTKLRNKMMTDMLSSIIRIKCYMKAHKVCCKTLKITEDMLNRFNSSIYLPAISSISDEQTTCLETILDLDEVASF